MVGDLMPSRLRVSKRQAAPTVPERLQEVLKENGNLRQEVQFYRLCSENALAMTNVVDKIAQQMMETFYFNAQGNMQQNVKGRDFAFDLQDAHQKFLQAAADAEAEWMTFWNISPVGRLLENKEF